jgi:hypothetical protein
MPCRHDAIDALLLAPMKIYNHDITLYTHDTHVSTRLYSGRALCLTNPGDKIQIHPELAPEWEAIVNHYQQIGLPHTDNVIWDVSIHRLAEELAQTPDPDLSVYFFGDVVNDHDTYRQVFQGWDAQCCQVIEFVNSKNNFIRLAEELGIAVPKTLLFEDLAAAKADDEIPFPCYVKPAVSDHGAGIRRCADTAELAIAFAQLAPDVPLQIQAEVNASAFLNLQYQVTAAGVEPLLVSEQILDGCVHGGNRYPASHEPWEDVAAFARWMGENGMQGIFAVDVAVVPAAETTHFVAIECNPRFNGSSYPTLVAKRLGIPAWSSATYQTQVRSLSDIPLADLAFDPATGKGVILINWGTIQKGKLGVLLAGSESEQASFGQELQARL